LTGAGAGDEKPPMNKTEKNSFIHNENLPTIPGEIDR
jgi:hypothetical protein